MSDLTKLMSHYGKQMIDGTCFKNFLNKDGHEHIAIVAKVVAVALATGITKVVPPIVIPLSAGLIAFSYMTASPLAKEQAVAQSAVRIAAGQTNLDPSSSLSISRSSGS